MSKTILILLALVAGMATPLVIDFALFGTISPCETVTRYEDGSSVQHCKVRG